MSVLCFVTNSWLVGHQLQWFPTWGPITDLRGHMIKGKRDTLTQKHISKDFCYFSKVFFCEIVELSFKPTNKGSTNRKGLFGWLKHIFAADLVHS